jgi:DNA-binding MarR family transcriptional regulator
MVGKTTERPKILGCTGLWLRMAARRVSQIYDQHLEPLGLTISQYGLLGQLKALDGISIGALAEKVIMDPTTLTRNLRPLEREGLVVFAADPHDRRSRRLHLTARGRAAYDKARPAWVRAQHQIDATLKEADAATLNATLARVLDRLAR